AQPMRITAIRTVLAVLAVFALMAVGANAQQDLSNVQVKTNKLSNNFYTLDGQGGTIGLLVGPDGVFMVDAQFAPLHDKIMGAIRQITNAPVKFVVNTHVHGDHTGGNEAMGQEGATVRAKRRDHDRRFLPLRPISQHRPGQRRRVEWHDCRAGTNHRAFWAEYENYSGSRSYRRSERCHRASRHDAWGAGSHLENDQGR